MDDLTIRPDLTIPGYELWFTASRSGGPGGQHANKTSSAVTLHWCPAQSGVLDDPTKQQLIRRLGSRINNDGVLQINAQDERSQHRNLELARTRMAETIAQALKRRKRRKRTRPSLASKRRRLNNKRRRGERKKLRQNPDPKEHT